MVGVVEEGVVKVVTVAMAEHNGRRTVSSSVAMVDTIMEAMVRMVAMDTPLPMAPPMVVDLMALQVMIKEVRGISDLVGYCAF